MEVKYTIDKIDDELLFLLPLNGIVLVNIKKELEFSDIEKLYEDLLTEGCPQILFYNHIIGNSDMLNWLTPRLIGSGFIANIAIRLPNKLPEIVCTHLIVLAEANLFFRLEDKLTGLTKDDVIFITDPTINVLSKMNSKIINGEIKARVAFKKDEISTEEVFNYKFFNMMPQDNFLEGELNVRT